MFLTINTQLSVSLHEVLEFQPIVKITCEQDGVSKYCAKTFNQQKNKKYIVRVKSKIQNNKNTEFN